MNPLPVWTGRQTGAFEDRIVSELLSCGVPPRPAYLNTAVFVHVTSVLVCRYIKVIYYMCYLLYRLCLSGFRRQPWTRLTSFAAIEWWGAGITRRALHQLSEKVRTNQITAHHQCQYFSTISHLFHFSNPWLKVTSSLIDVVFPNLTWKPS